MGQRHTFQQADLSVKMSGHTPLHGLRFADWDSDGDMDVLVAEHESLWFYERLPGPGDSFEKHKLMPFWQSGFEVADWDGDLQLFDFHWFLVLRRFLCTKTCGFKRAKGMVQCFNRLAQVMGDRICWFALARAAHSLGPLGPM